jgi:MFS family permease
MTLTTLRKERPEAARPQFDSKYANRALVLFGLVVILVMYVEIMLAPSIPRIRLDYSVTLGETSLILALYTIFGTAITPIVGKLGDIYGKKKVLMYVLFAYSIMVTRTSFTPNFTTLLVSRTFQGVGLTVIPLALSLAREQFPRELVPRAQALISAMMMAGIGLGLSAGAFVSNSFGWQANYHIATPIVIALTLFVALVVRESPYKNAHARLDYVGSLILGSSLAMIILGLAEGSQWGWTSLPILGLFSIGGLLFAPLVLYERRVKQPLLDFAQLKARNVMVSNFLALTTGAAVLLSFTSLIYKLESARPSGYGYDILTTGLYILPWALVMLFSSYPIGVLSSRFGVRPFLLIGSLVAALGFILMVTQTTAIQIPEFISLGAIGMAMVIVSTQVLLVLSTKPTEMASITSINRVFFNLGQSMGAPIAASILSTYVATVAFAGRVYSYPSAEAFQYTFWLGAGLFAASFLISLFAREVIGRKAKTTVTRELKIEDTSATAVPVP